MKFHTARQVIHDAFLPGPGQVDISEIRVQFSGKGSDNKTMDHCEKGLIQQALQVQKVRDPLAWAWNMYAYTPPGTQNGFERSKILQWLASTFRDQGYGNPFLDPTGAVMQLARVAMADISYEDVTRKRKRRKYADMGRMLSMDPETYEKQWHRHYVFFRGLCQRLPERSLPPIANIIWMILDKGSEDPVEAKAAGEDLLRALKIPMGGVV